MRRRSMICLMFLLCTANAQAQEDTHSANYVMTGCHIFLDQPESVTPLDAFLSGNCVGLVVGEKAMAGATHLICVPDQSTSTQAVKVVVRYIVAPPGRTHEPFVRLAFDAMHAAWPCKK